MGWVTPSLSTGRKECGFTAGMFSSGLELLPGQY